MLWNAVFVFFSLQWFAWTPSIVAGVHRELGHSLYKMLQILLFQGTQTCKSRSSPQRASTFSRNSVHDCGDIVLHCHTLSKFDADYVPFPTLCPENMMLLATKECSNLQDPAGIKLHL